MSSPGANEITDCIRRDILPAIPPHLDQLTSDTVATLQGRLQALRFFCAARGTNDAVLERLSAAVSVTQGLWELLEQNASTFVYLRQMETIRWLDLGSSSLGAYEDALAGETTMREFAVNTIATCLGWISDTIWVELARQDQQAVPKIHALRLQDELWKVLGETRPSGSNVTLQDAMALHEKMAVLFNLLTNESLPSGGRAVLLSAMYVLVLSLNLEKALVLLAKPAK